ncbi:MAG TPA: pyrroline-5-carboxylate reductase [Gammaproteobacteria bacterium]|nr:pyrroline-5-carboxylate reductase [Gammaproteobacteria bacterium]
MSVSTRLAFIGGGNMASSLIGGLIADGWSPDAIHVSDPDPVRREALAARFGVHTGDDNSAAVQGARAVVLAVKPQVMRSVTEALAPAVQENRPLVISVAAGIRIADLERWLGGELPVVRSMPNTPALVGSGATALCANPRVDEAGRELAESLLRAVGIVIWLEEEALIDSVTALSGSGPAYVFLFIEALEEAGQELGLPADQAHLLAVQTVFGAAKMALERSESPAELRRQVTSPGGTTERALAVLEEGGMRGLVLRALEAARLRARELADELGGT